VSCVTLDGKTVLVTGAAGFIGAHLVKRLCALEKGVTVVGIDNMNGCYDVGLKEARLRELSANPSFHFIRGDIADRPLLDRLFEVHQPQIVVNLANQAGVRYSVTNPDTYIKSNIVGFFNVLEACRRSYERASPGVEHLVYASSSSVYGAGRELPYRVESSTDCPVSLYAATKKSDELLAYAYSKLYGIPATALRFFTVYGPAGRPDMAYFRFTDQLRAGETIQLFNYGSCRRDFTYIDDAVEGVVRIIGRAPNRAAGEDGLPLPPHAVYNIGNSRPEGLLNFADILQQELVRAKVLPADYDFAAHRALVPMQPGDVPATCADTSALERDFGFKPSTSLRDGLRKFAEWYAKFYMDRGAAEEAGCV